MERNSCRICFSSERIKLLSLFSVKIDDTKITEMINFLAGIEMQQGDDLPDKICVECLNHLSAACEMKRKCVDADKKIKELLQVHQNNKTHEDNCAISEAEGASDQDPEINLPAKMTRQKKNHQKSSQLASNSEARETRSNKIKQPEQIRNTRSKAKPTSAPLPTKDFFCDLCQFSSNRKKNLERHLLAVHLKLFKFPCPETGCNREYTTQAALKLHSVRDHEEVSPFNCDKCDQKFSCESLLRIHSQRLSCRPRKPTQKAFEKTLSCPHCDFRTAHQFSLSQHVNLIHLNIRKTWKCSHCDSAEFTNRTSLNHHIFSVHNLSHIRCPSCNQAFTSKEQLKSHKDSLKCNARKATDEDFEESENGVKCNLCNRNYKNKKDWITHYFNHHKFKNFCNICKVQLATYASLKNHKKTIHDGEKRFECTKCEKKFTAKHTLEFHLNTHSGIKPYSCKFCSFKASDRSSVSKHQKKLHSDEK